MRSRTCIMTIFLAVLFLSAKDADTESQGRLEPFYDLVSRKGRTEVMNDQTIALIGSASAVEFRVQTDAVVLRVRSEYKSGNSFVIAINDLYQGRYLLKDDEVRELKITLSEQQVNKVGIFKATEAATGNVIIAGIDSDAPLEKVPDRSKTIEFIGNSITCGAAADTQTIPCGTGYYHDQHNAYLAYGPRVARALEVDYFLSSVSGIGIYRNWNDENQLEPIMPEVYENLYLNGSRQKDYEFSVMPDLVSICLGTNDLSGGDGVKKRLPFNKDKFIANYVEFVKNVRHHYPRAKIALLSSPVLDRDRNELLIDCLREVRERLRPQIEVSLFEFDPIKAKGCTGHPSIEDHDWIAQTLLPFYEKLISRK